MVYLKRFAFLIILALIGVFVALNQSELGRTVPIHFFKLEASLILGFWLVIAFAAGVALFLAIDLPRTLSLKRDLRRKANEIARLRAELDRAAAPGPADPGKRPSP
jgi:uncharacterized integral membrane protein